MSAGGYRVFATSLTTPRVYRRATQQLICRCGEASIHGLSVVRPAEERLHMNRDGVAAAVLVSVCTNRPDGRYLQSAMADVHGRGCGDRWKIWRVWQLGRMRLSVIVRDVERWSM